MAESGEDDNGGPEVVGMRMKPEFDHQPARDHIEHETRFAVVLYGGVSLAVYISGVCQELLHMTRATSFGRVAPEAEATELPKVPEAGTAKAEAAEEVDRPRPVAPTGPEIAYRLAATIGGLPKHRSKALLDLKGLLDDYEDSTDRPDGERVADLAQAAADLDVRRRFVVDILSGSSAGGLNAAFLAKALVADASLDGLKKLWVDQGDFRNLLNDEQAVAEHDKLEATQRATEAGEVESLLSGELMFLKLLSAFEAIDEEGEKRDDPDPLVDALDTYLTTTDLAGLSLPIQLGPQAFITENRHRSVFHLAFGTERASGSDLNHLAAKYSEHLAFMARATSAHPAAFTPAQVNDVADRLAAWRSKDSGLPSIARDDFLASRISPRLRFGQQPWPEEMPHRWYSDGGAMDNKPFTYALDPIQNRHAEVPVDRHMLYVEPDPEPAFGSLSNADRPSLGDATLGAYGLGRAESIRGDIERVLDRNATLERLTQAFEDHVAVLAQNTAAQPRARNAWAERSYAEIVASDGETVLAYELAKVGRVGAELGQLMATVAGLASDSAQHRSVVERARRFTIGKFVPPSLGDVMPDMAVHRRLLLRVDLGFRLRRLRYLDQVLRRLQQAILNGETELMAKKWRLADDFSGDDDPDDASARFELLRAVRRDLNEAYVDLRTIGRRLRSARPMDAYADRLPRWRKLDSDETIDGETATEAKIYEALPLDRSAAHLERWPEQLPEWAQHEDKHAGTPEDIAEGIGDDEASVDPQDEVLNTILEELGDVLDPWFHLARSKVEAAIARLDQLPRLHDLVQRVFNDFAHLDQSVLPSWEVAKGELAAVTVARISPLDASALMTVSQVPGHEVGKLAGNALGHFGGFLDERWRANDIMWGRLDAAEVLLKRLLPDPAHHHVRDRLVRLAHDRILAEEWSTVCNLTELSKDLPAASTRSTW